VSVEPLEPVVVARYAELPVGFWQLALEPHPEAEQQGYFLAELRAEIAVTSASGLWWVVWAKRPSPDRRGWAEQL